MAHHRAGHLPPGVSPHGRAAQPVHHDPRIRPRYDLPQIGQATDEADQSHRLRRCHRQNGVGGAEHRLGRPVAAGRGRVERQFLVHLQAEPAVDHDKTCQPSRQCQHNLDGRRAKLRPPRRTGDPRQDPQPPTEVPAQHREPGHVQSALIRRPSGGGKPRRLFQQPQQLTDRSTVDISVDEQRGQSHAGELGGQAQCHRGTARRAGGTPNRDHSPRAELGQIRGLGHRHHRCHGGETRHRLAVGAAGQCRLATVGKRPGRFHHRGRHHLRG